MKCQVLTAPIAVAIATFAGVATAADRCVAYGDATTDFTWKLCPAGEKQERRYLYFGIWSGYYSVPGDAGVCNWSSGKSGWVCPDRVIRCDAKQCPRG
jgi:hypothetical protein